jgi:hypothetical protein
VVILLAGAAVGITVLVTEPFRGETTRAEPRPALGAQPARVWTLDVTQLTGNDNDVLLALPQTFQTCATRLERTVYAIFGPVDGGFGPVNGGIGPVDGGIGPVGGQ